eukprot:TRINITY_DN4098_c0_g1_i2.p1 TRINITY_DN4098_c0_g1~~TRINITY_DN4098_c0_g1_i2.p1  ORF type:complete len:109 (-),score=27.02 TRINITY_DN4098_c0_g1_i2:204-497(-)
MNFLYQASYLVAPANADLSRFYNCTLQRIAHKLVLRLSPNVKRTICKRCFTLLVPGRTATVSIRRTLCYSLVLRAYVCFAAALSLTKTTQFCHVVRH